MESCYFNPFFLDGFTLYQTLLKLGKAFLGRNSTKKLKLWTSSINTKFKLSTMIVWLLHKIYVLPHLTDKQCLQDRRWAVRGRCWRWSSGASIFSWGSQSKDIRFLVEQVSAMGHCKCGWGQHRSGLANGWGHISWWWWYASYWWLTIDVILGSKANLSLSAVRFR